MKCFVKWGQWRIKGGGKGGGRSPQEQDELGNPRCLKEVKEEETPKKVKKMKKKMARNLSLHYGYYGTIF